MWLVWFHTHSTLLITLAMPCCQVLGSGISDKKLRDLINKVKSRSGVRAAFASAVQMTVCFIISLLKKSDAP